MRDQWSSWLLFWPSVLIILGCTSRSNPAEPATTPTPIATATPGLVQFSKLVPDRVAAVISGSYTHDELLMIIWPSGRYMIEHGHHELFIKSPRTPPPKGWWSTEAIGWVRSTEPITGYLPRRPTKRFFDDLNSVRYLDGGPGPCGGPFHPMGASYEFLYVIWEGLISSNIRCPGKLPALVEDVEALFSVGVKQR